MDTKTMKKQFRSILSPKGARHPEYHAQAERYVHLAHAHARGMPHEAVERRVRHDNLPSAYCIRRAYIGALQADKDGVLADGTSVPTEAELATWATVPESRIRPPWSVIGLRLRASKKDASDAAE